MNRIIKQCEDLWALKKLNSNERTQMILVIKFLLQQEKWARAREISEQTWVPKSRVDRWLRRLKKFDIIETTGGNIKYIRDEKYDSIVFPGQINEKVKEHLRYLYQDIILRTEIQSIINQKIETEYNICLTQQAFINIDIFLENLEKIVGNKELLSFYMTLYDDIKQADLYSSLLCRYWGLNRQRIANRYKIKK